MKTEREKIKLFLKKNSNYAKKLISKNYAFSHLQVGKYRDYLDWDQVSMNNNIHWDENLIEDHKNRIAWDYFTTSSSAFSDIALLDKFDSLIEWKGRKNVAGDTVVFNTYIPWSIELIEKYKSKIDFYKLSMSGIIPWSKELIDKYRDRLCFYELMANEKIKEKPELFEKVKEIYYSQEGGNKSKSGVEDVFNSTFNSKHTDKISDLTDNYRKEISIDFIKENLHVINFAELSQNNNLPWSLELIDAFKDEWDWSKLCTNQSIKWDEKMIDYFYDKIVWGGWRAARKEELLDFIAIMEWGLMSNLSIKWTLDMLIKYNAKVDFECLFFDSDVWNDIFKHYVDEPMIVDVLK